MAVHERDRGQQTTQGPNPHQGPSYQDQTPPPGAPVYSLFDTGLFGAPIPRTRGSEMVNKLVKEMSEYYKSVTAGLVVDILSIDNESSELDFSVILVCVYYEANPAFGLCYHTLIVEASGQRPSSFIDTFEGRQIEIVRVAGDAYNEAAKNIINRRVFANYPNIPREKVYAVDAEVVPMEFNIENKNKVYQMAMNAGLACTTELRRFNPEYRDASIAPPGQGKPNLQIDLAFNPIGSEEDIAGNPVRMSALINFAVVSPNTPGRLPQFNTGARERKITAVGGFIDLLWCPVVPQQPMGYTMGYLPPGYPQPVISQKLIPRFVITSMDSTSAFTPAAFLFALASTVALQNGNWMQYFRGVTGSGRDKDMIDLHDVGAANIECNIQNEPGYGSPIDTKQGKYSLADLGFDLQRMIRPELLISIDVPDCGPSTWYQSIFVAAAMKSAAARAILYRAAMDLTNGHFEKYFTQNDDMFIAEAIDRIHLGYWTDPYGQKRDIREIDYLAVANTVASRPGGDPKLIRAWSDTFLRRNVFEGIRTTERLKIIRGVANESAVVTGMASRVTPTIKLLDGIIKGCTDAGLELAIKTPLSAGDMSDARGTADFLQAGMVTPGAMFQLRPPVAYGQPRAYSNVSTRF